MTAPIRPLRPRASSQLGYAGQPTDDDGTGLKPASTFAGMQQRGVARPAPPPGSSYYGGTAGNSYYQGTGAGAAPPGSQAGATFTPPVDPNRQALTSAVGQLLAQPSAYQTDQLQNDLGTFRSQQALDDTAAKQQIDQTMAARGLHASSLTGDAYGALAKQDSLNEQKFGQDYLDKEASDLTTARSNAIASALGLQTENSNEGLAAFGANQASQKQASDEQIARGQLGVDQQNAGTNAAAQQATQAYQTGQLGLSAQQLASDNANATADREEKAKEAANSLGLNYAQLSQQDKEFLANLSSTNTNAAADRTQQLSIAQMQDKTANHGIDTSASTAQNQLLYSIMAMLGLPTAGLTGLSGSGSSVGGGGSSTGSAGAGIPGVTSGQTGAGAGGTDQNTTDPFAAMLNMQNNPILSQLRTTDPATYASVMLAQAQAPGAVPGLLDSPNDTINFGGKQYTPRQYLQLMQSQPNLFKESNTQNDQFFADAAKSATGNAAAYQNYYATGQLPGASSSAPAANATAAPQQRPQIASGQSWTGDSGLTLSNPDPANPGNTMLTYNGKQYSVVGTTAAGRLGAGGSTSNMYADPVPGQDRYYLQDAQGNIIEGPPIGSEYQQFTGAYNKAGVSGSSSSYDTSKDWNAEAQAHPENVTTDGNGGTYYHDPASNMLIPIGS